MCIHKIEVKRSKTQNCLHVCTLLYMRLVYYLCVRNFTHTVHRQCVFFSLFFFLVCLFVCQYHVWYALCCMHMHMSQPKSVCLCVCDMQTMILSECVHLMNVSIIMQCSMQPLIPSAYEIVQTAYYE